MSHHYSGPNLVFPRGDARLDYTDLFAFPKPGDPSKSILIMDVHPSFDVLQAGPTTAEPFAPEGLYEIKIDTDGDTIADITYQVRFATGGGGAQTATPRSRRTMPVSSAPSRMRSSIGGGLRRWKPGGWQGHCCRTCCTTTPRARRPTRTMAAHPATTPPMPSWLSSRMGK